MPEPQAHETLAGLIAIIRDDKKYGPRAAELTKREADIAAKHAEVSALAKAAADDRDVATTQRAQLEKLNTEQRGELARRESETTTAYKFQQERDADLKKREAVLTERSKAVDDKEATFTARDKACVRRENELTKAEGDLKARIDAYNKRLAAHKEIAEQA